jgi:hypothetical protein
MAALANSDLVVGDQAIVDNPNGTGANLRSDLTVLDDSTVIAEVPQDTIVTLIDGPIPSDAGTWFQVKAPGDLTGFISTSMLQPVEVDGEGAATETDAVDTSEEETSALAPDLLRQEPIDVGFVVDDNNAIPAEGLACRTTPTVDGEIITRIRLLHRLR